MSTFLSYHATEQFAQLRQRTAKEFEVESTARHFAVAPTIAQHLNEEITATADFLKRINVIPVDEPIGQPIKISMVGPISSRTDTRSADRVAKDFHDLNGDRYELVSTETDVGISFAKVDAWAKFKDFYERYYQAVRKQLALDRMMIGFHGTHAATQTNIATYPRLQDVNKGWLQHAREKVPLQVITGGATAGVIKIGPTGDYANLDALVLKVKRLIHPDLRAAGDLVAIIGSDLLDAEKAKLYVKQGETTTEKERIETARVADTYGGLPSFLVPFFPANAVLVTSWDNLSIYYQRSSWRRHLVENSQNSRIEDFNSRNEGYVIEHTEKIAMAENVTYVI